MKRYVIQWFVVRPGRRGTAPGVDARLCETDSLRKIKRVARKAARQIATQGGHNGAGFERSTWFYDRVERRFRDANDPQTPGKMTGL